MFLQEGIAAGYFIIQFGIILLLVAIFGGLVFYAFLKSMNKDRDRKGKRTFTPAIIAIAFLALAVVVVGDWVCRIKYD